MPSLSEDDVYETFLALAIEARELAGIVDASVVTSSPSSSSPSFSSFSHNSSFHLHEPPSALKFSRIVAEHLPALIDGVAQRHFPRAYKEWKRTSHLCSRMSGRKVKVALTPNGRADDIVIMQSMKDERQAEETRRAARCARTFDELFLALHPNDEEGKQGMVAYLQSQDSNLTSKEENLAGDFAPLLRDLQWAPSSSSASSSSYSAPPRTDIPWATEALGVAPEATNIWIGTSRSQSSMHRDHYENLFTCFRGKKTFTLYPPWENFFFEGDDVYDVYRWRLLERKEGEDTCDYVRGSALFELAKEDSPPTPWIQIDPTQPVSHPRNAKHSIYVRARASLPPIRVEVHEGQTLYLPSGWYHHVAQEEDDESDAVLQREGEGVCLCVNWWYESTVNDRWAWSSFATQMGKRVRGTFENDDVG
ncbi:Clavaminate synthase-like protein [Tilletiaria anomala UBC 951]|uniref:Clavaminate synthase-like protein n=1 Tax=Tilletiaria anomala (strain ATCC 24038 / CBS 436.72 / UBC 951) TaxID=1037660 RepID=A0A066VZK8_TILAU|nr:Clavaminate synthase-like protein [Tilletiaria anomala UBC 951]KDN44249.1 Clavaminate synthase-like protein [Tilletiaria anomala UBC 951]